MRPYPGNHKEACRIKNRLLPKLENSGYSEKTMARKSGRVWIGCSGFSYSHWKDGVFYPPGLAQRQWLEYYAEKFSTVELNVTFYRLPAPANFISWQARTPKGFVFVLKGSKLITHLHDLKNVSELVKQFMERGLLLEEKLGPILWQTKPSFKKDLPRLQAFVQILSGFPGTRHAFEFRNPTWFDSETYRILADAGMTVCRADQPQGLPEPPDDFPFLYLRRHGPAGQAYRGCYSKEQLETDARLIRKWLGEGKAVYAYFNNDLGGHAPANALELQLLLKQGPARL